MRQRQRRQLIESLESRLFLAANSVAAGLLFTDNEGVRQLKMQWKGEERIVFPNSWLVQLDGYSGNLLSQEQQARPQILKAGSAFRIERHLGASGLFDAYVPTSITPEETLRRFAKVPGFRYAEPNFVYHLDSTPNDPQFANMWGVHNTGQNAGGFGVGTPDADIDAPEAWDITRGSNDVVVGMLDSGIQYTHPDLAANCWINPGEIAGNGIDDELNGYIDDVRGYDFFGNGGAPGVPDSDPADQTDHGTHTAGTVGAVGNNGVGVTGVSQKVKLVALKIGGSGSAIGTNQAISAMNYVLDLRLNRNVNIRVINCSWGGGGFSAGLSNAITNLGNNGILVVCAAGNGGVDFVGDNNDFTPHYPSSYTQTNVIAVANMTNVNTREGSSNFGTASVDLFAPGTNTLSTVRTVVGSYAYLTGTSMSSPHVAGVAALCWAAAPLATSTQVRDGIINNTEAVPAFSGLCVSGGRLSADNAINAVLAAAQPAPPPLPELDSFSDSGLSDIDLNTNDTTPLIFGTAQPGTTVTILADNVPVGTGVATGGSYSINTSVLADGVRSITATTTNAQGTSAPSPALLVTIDTAAPTIVGGVNFVFITQPHKLVYTFSEDVSATLANSDVTVTKLPSTPIAKSFSYNGGLNQGTFDFGAILADGDYTAALTGSGVTDVAGNAMANNNFPFFFMMADFNHDRFVNSNDFSILATNFGTTGKNFAQGDANYDSIVNANDFSALATRFGTGLASTAGAAVGAPRLPSGRLGQPTTTAAAPPPGLFGDVVIGGSTAQDKLGDLIDQLTVGNSQV